MVLAELILLKDFWATNQADKQKVKRIKALRESKSSPSESAIFWCIILVQMSNPSFGMASKNGPSALSMTTLLEAAQNLSPSPRQLWRDIIIRFLERTKPINCKLLCLKYYLFTGSVHLTCISGLLPHISGIWHRENKLYWLERMGFLAVRSQG